MISPQRATLTLFEGVDLAITNRRVRRTVIVSLLVNAAVFFLLLGGIGLVIINVTDDLLDGHLLWQGAGWMLRVAGFAALLFVSPALFYLLTSIILPAIQEPVFRSAREQSGGPPAGDERNWMRTNLMIAGVSLRRLLRFLVLSILILPLNLLPGIGTLAYVICQFALSSLAIGSDLLSWHFELHALPYRAQRAYLARHRGMVLAVGSVATLLCLLPPVNILFLTTNVAGAGVLSALIDREEHLPLAGTPDVG